MVADSGAVFYQLQTDKLNSLPDDYPAENLIVPASEIIHDRCMTVHHSLIGVPPLAAAYWPALKNMKIMRNATDFFANNAQPGGLLTAPAGMTEADAEQVKNYWTEQFAVGGAQYGKIAVIGADMKFTPFAMKSIDSQMIEQMRYGDEQICQPFGIPPFKVGIGTLPSGLGVDGLNQLYYADALQTHIEHMEALLDEGLGIARPLGVELDLDPLLRMDEGKRADVETKLVQGKIKTPDEGRARFNLAPTGGGDTLWGQAQDYALGDLARRSEWDQAMQTPVAAPAPEPEEEEELSPEQRAYLMTRVKASYEHQTA
jgi:HK97 family phage portal protein